MSSCIMDEKTAKGALLRYFNVGHEVMLWKLGGLSDYDARRPLTPTGSNVLGLMKHVAWVELGYFGETFGRAPDIELPANADEPNADMYATADESRAEIVALFNMAWTHAQATIDALDIDAEGHVPWWGDQGEPVSLVQIMVHTTTELHRHLGQIDIVRELIDGEVGMRDGSENMPDGLPVDYWPTYCAQLETIAQNAAS